MEEKDELRKALELKNARSSGRDFWHFKDKGVMEWGAVREILLTAGLKIEGDVTKRTDDPPDCEAVIDGERCGIEATELVHQEALQRTKQSGQELHFVWDKENFCRELQSRITRKDRADNVKGAPYQRYILVIFTDEFFLNRNDVEGFIAGTSFRATFITDVFLGLSYDATIKEYPVFRLQLNC
jgi:hypothetical protein